MIRESTEAGWIPGCFSICGEMEIYLVKIQEQIK